MRRSDSVSTTAGSATPRCHTRYASMAAPSGAIYTIDLLILCLKCQLRRLHGRLDLDRQLGGWYCGASCGNAAKTPPSHNPLECDGVQGGPSTGACWQWSRAFAVGTSRVLQRAVGPDVSETSDDRCFSPGDRAESQRISRLTLLTPTGTTALWRPSLALCSLPGDGFLSITAGDPAKLLLEPLFPQRWI